MGAEIRLSTQRSILKTDTRRRIIPVSILPGEFNPHRVQAHLSPPYGPSLHSPRESSLTRVMSFR